MPAMRIFLCCYFLCAPAIALEVDDWLQINGFGTLGAFHGDDSVATVRVDPRQKYGAQNETRFDGDSQLSLQAIVNPRGVVKGVVQLLSKQDYQGSQAPQIEWAYLSWDASPELNIKLGRTIAPVLLMSDYRNVFYAQTMVRPPPEVYNVNSISNLDGISASWSRNLGEGELTLETYLGTTSIDFNAGSSDIHQMFGLSALWSEGPYKVRLGYSYNNATFNSVTGKKASQAIATLPVSQCSNCQTEIDTRVKFDRISNHITTLAVVYDHEQWLTQAELVYRQSQSITVGDVVAGYAMLGYRYGDFTPYLALAATHIRDDEMNLQAGSLATPAIKTQLNYLNQSRFGRGLGDHSTFTAGLRWDVGKNIALKTQIDYVNYRSSDIGSSGGLASFPTSLLGTPNGFDGSLMIYTLNLDFVF
ncbi:hypothetical protein K4H28_13600 [Deefgea tanakiae]|uniref:Porin n=1 Tax=Deefgea tanakiae TaxID=2865840 RepID=A0ABX8Z400_9NEIS|nr:hypothetical protein [Deefgea tanakiae]QZA77307.1 hypothetical protein K4H28_13600 [Deefgea tanakiae]